MACGFVMLCPELDKLPMSSIVVSRFQLRFYCNLNSNKQLNQDHFVQSQICRIGTKFNKAALYKLLFMLSLKFDKLLLSSQV